MAITLRQITEASAMPSLKQVVVGAAVAACKDISDETDVANHAQRLAFAKSILVNPQTAAEPMVRVILMNYWDTAALTWNDSPESGEDNIVINATDEQVKDAVLASWDIFAAVA